jgi:dTDP-glucose pyrophosphorylase
MTKKEKINQRLINKEDTLIHALKIMDTTGFRSLIVINSKNLFEGILSIGDIQRAIIKNIGLECSISKVLRDNPKIGKIDTLQEKIKEQMLEFRMEFMPIIDTHGSIIEVCFWEDLFLEAKVPPAKHFNMPIVIMAGGMGKRLRPLTNVLPKPLIPIGDKTIIEDIFERFERYGCNEFYISLNYKADLIEYYLKDQRLKYNLTFIKEEKPMGTAGSLSLLKGRLNQTFFVSNCDILIEQDYSEILDFHYSNKNEITVVAALKHFPIAYGTIETGKNGRLLKLEEKPEFTFKINSGMYILEPHLLEEIPTSQFFHITHLIELILERNGIVGVFPVSEKSWKDIGEWNVYIKEILNNFHEK